MIVRRRRCGRAFVINDFRGSRRQLDRPVVVVTSIEDVVPQPRIGSFNVSHGSVDRDAVQSGDLVVLRRGECDVGREVGKVEVADSQGMGGDDVPDVDDRCRHDVVEPVTFEEPAPAVLAEVGERLAADEMQRGDEVGHPLGAAALAANAETPEQVEIAEDPVEGVRPGTPSWCVC